MNKRVAALALALCVALCAFPVASLAAAKQMNDGVPVWDEKTVKEYARDYIAGQDLERLRGYYDLQIRRYMPMSTYGAMLAEIHWMTGDFIQFGTYSSFAEPERRTKTHVLHLCMEKRDLDMYFVHKDKPDDWEIMALEFIPAEKQAISGDPDAGEGEEALRENAPAYTRIPVTLGEGTDALEGILTLPQGATADQPVPGCVLVQDQGLWDMDGTLGQTKFLEDMADAFAQKGIATLRYHNRAYAAGLGPQELAPLPGGGGGPGRPAGRKAAGGPGRGKRQADRAGGPRPGRRPGPPHRHGGKGPLWGDADDRGQPLGRFPGDGPGGYGSDAADPQAENPHLYRPGQPGRPGIGGKRGGVLRGPAQRQGEMGGLCRIPGAEPPADEERRGRRTGYPEGYDYPTKLDAAAAELAAVDQGLWNAEEAEWYA